MLLNILKIVPNPFFADRGGLVRVLEQTLELMRRGHKVTICAYHNGRPIDSIDVRRIINIPWYKRLDAGANIHRFYLDFFLFLKTTRESFKVKPDIIHAHLHEGVFCGKFSASIHKIPLLFDAQGSLTEEMVAHNFVKRNGLSIRLLKKFEYFLNTFPNKIIVSNSFARELFINQFGVKPDKISVIIDGVDTGFFKPGLPSENLKNKLNIPKDKLVVVFLGLLNTHQGIDYLLESIKYINSKRKDVIFVIMGFPNVGKYREISVKMGIENQIRFTGKIDYFKAPYFLSLGNIAVSPKLFATGQGNGKLLNYMASGLPIVVFDHPVNREILGDDGIYAEYGNAESFAERILCLADDHDLRSKVGKRLRERACQLFSWKILIKKIEKEYMCLFNDLKKKKVGTNGWY